MSWVDRKESKNGKKINQFWDRVRKRGSSKTYCIVKGENKLS